MPVKTAAVILIQTLQENDTEMLPLGGTMYVKPGEKECQVSLKSFISFYQFLSIISSELRVTSQGLCVTLVTASACVGVGYGE